MSETRHTLAIYWTSSIRETTMRFATRETAQSVFDGIIASMARGEIYRVMADNNTTAIRTTEIAMISVHSTIIPGMWSSKPSTDDSMAASIREQIEGPGAYPR